MFNLNPTSLHQLASSIMTSNRSQQIHAYEEILLNQQTLLQVLQLICHSKKIYFVTSELLLRILKTNANELKSKISTNINLLMTQSLHLEEYKARTLSMYKSILQNYILVVCQNLETLQKHEYNQAIQIITLSLSQILNLSNQAQQPHIKIIRLFFTQYYQAKQQQNTMLDFLFNYKNFNTILTKKELILPDNIKLYKILINVMSEVINMKENWDQGKYSVTQFMNNHKIFKNKFLNQWVQFTIQQSKIVFQLYLNSDNILFGALVLKDVVKLLYEIVMFSYESTHQTTYELIKQRFVRFPQYKFPEGILRYLGEDYTFLQTLHRVYLKVTNENTKINKNNVNLNQQRSGQITPSIDSTLICDLILRMYGRLFFLKPSSSLNQQQTLQNQAFVQSQLELQSENTIDNNNNTLYKKSNSMKMQNNQKSIFYNPIRSNTVYMSNTATSNKYLNSSLLVQKMELYLTKVTILSEIIRDPETNLKGSISEDNGDNHSKYILYYGIVQILSSFLVFVNVDLANQLQFMDSQLQSTYREQMKKFLVAIINFAYQQCLNKKIWKIMYGDYIKNNQIQQIFKQIRHQQLFFAGKVFDLLFQCHVSIDKRFLNPANQISQIRQFYQKYFQIANQFIIKLEEEFSTKISIIIKDDFLFEYNFLKEVLQSLPYIKIKENKYVAMTVVAQQNRIVEQTMMKENILQYSFSDGKSVSSNQNALSKGQKVLDYFEKFDDLLGNICKAVQQKALFLVNNRSNLNSVQPQLLQSIKNSLNFFYYFVSILIEHYIQNSKFYSKKCQNLVKIIKLLLKIGFQLYQKQYTSAVFIFYEQIIIALSEKAFNCRYIVDIIFQTEQEAINIKITEVQNGLRKENNFGSFYDLKNKPTQERALELVKKMMRITCERLITTDIKELDAVIIVLQRIKKEFYRKPFITQFSYLKQFVQNHLNQNQTLLSQSKYIEQKRKFIAIYIGFLQFPQNKFTVLTKSLAINLLNTAIFLPFSKSSTLQNFIAYIQCIQQILNSYQQNKLMVIDMFLYTINGVIQQINKNFRKFIKENIKFYQSVKKLLLRLLDTVELFGGDSWGIKCKDDRSEDDESYQRNKFAGGKIFDVGDQPDIQWEDVKQDDELPLLVQEYFYTWVKELGRQQYQVENSGLWTKQKRQSHNRQIVTIYTQFMHLTTTGKMPPLPKIIVEKQRKQNQFLLGQIHDSNSSIIPPLQQFINPYNETKTTKLLIRIYLQNLYRITNTTLFAIYPSIDYRIEYITKWWQQVMIRNLRPQINVTFVYKKFVTYSSTAQFSESNRLLAQLLFKIANYYKNDKLFIENYVQEPYRVRLCEKAVVKGSLGIRYENKNNQNVNINGMNQAISSMIVYEFKKDYLDRIMMFWQHKGPNIFN